MNIHHEKIEKEYTLTRHTYTPGGREELRHWHRNIEYLYILKGSFQLELSDESFLCRSGDAVIIECGEIHKFIRIDEDCEMYICTFRPELLGRMGREIRYIKSHISADELQKAMPEENIASIFREMYKEYGSGLSMSENIIRSDIVRLYSLLVRHFERKDGVKLRSFRGLEDFQAALTFISENYSEKIALKDVAEKINYNPSYVSTLFVNYTGVNFKTYLDTVRIQHAAELLKNTDEKITDIAMKCGYDNLKTFNNTFRRITGVSPGKFREESK